MTPTTLPDVRRVWVVGTAGSGKTTTAAAIAARVAVPHLELDSVFHQPGWEPLDELEFRHRVEGFVAERAWVIDGIYSAVADLVRPRADTIVWLNLPRSVVMRQLILRTIRRVGRREVLWNGNRERWRNFFTLDPEESVIAWAWTHYDENGRRFEAMQAEVESTPAAGATFVRLRSRAQVDAFLAALAPTRQPPPEPGSGK